MSLEASLQSLTVAIPDCLASGYLDMESGLLLGLSAADPQSSPGLDILGAAVADVFQGTTVPMIESLFTIARRAEGDNSDYFQEMVIFSGDFLHVFMRTRQHPNHLVCYTCRKSANVGLILAKARQGVEALTPAA